MYDYNYMTNTTSSIQGSFVWFIIAAVLAVIGGIVIYFLFVRTDKKEDNKYLAWFKDFANFVGTYLPCISSNVVPHR